MSLMALQVFTKINTNTTDEILSDITEQAIVLAKSLNTKMKIMQLSINIIYGGLFFMGCLLVLKIIVQ